MKLNFIKYFKQYENAQFYSTLCSILGLFLLVYYFYIRVIIEKAPKDIPFPYTIYSFVLLSGIIIIYAYVLFRIYNPKNPPKFVLKLLPYIQKLYLPLYALDELFRTNKYTKKILKKLYIFLGQFAYKYNLFYEHSILKSLYIIFIYAPRFILLVLLGVDIMYFSCIKYLYYFSILLFVPLIFQYFIYLMKKLTEEQIKYLEENFYIILLSKNDGTFSCYDFLEMEINKHNMIKVRSFIDVQALELGDGKRRLYEYQCVETEEAREAHAKKIGLEELPWQILNKPNIDEYSVEIAKKFYKWMPPTILVACFINSYDSTILVYKIKEKSQSLIFLGYLFCWSYVFFVTFIGIDLLLEILFKVKPPNEPFD